MNEPEIFARLTTLHSALVEKLGAQPYLGSVDLRMTGGGDCIIAIYDKCHVDGGTEKSLKFVRQPTIDAAFSDAEAFIAAMPDLEAAKLTAWHGKLADVIDEGHDLNLPDTVMTPLRQSSQAMTENLLTHAAE